MLVGVNLTAEWQGFAFAFGIRLGQRIGLHRQLVQRLSLLLCYSFCWGFVFGTNQRGIRPKAHFIKINLRHRLPYFIAFAVIRRHPHPVHFPRVFGHQQLLPHQHTFNLFYAVIAAAEADFQIRRYLGFFRRT